MSIRKHMAAFAATQELIGAQADTLRHNPVEHGDFETNDGDHVEDLGIVHSAVSSSLRQMKSDLHALSRTHHHDPSDAHGHDVHGSEPADEQ
jgi:hypothetical protein